MTTAERTAKRKAEHRCVTCGQQIPIDISRVTCLACYEKVRSYRKSAGYSEYMDGKRRQAVKRKIKGICTTCGRKLCETDGDNVRCGICRQKERFKKKRLREERMKAGLCVMCGKQNDRNGLYKSCSECSARNKWRHENDIMIGIRREDNERGKA